MSCSGESSEESNANGSEDGDGDISILDVFADQGQTFWDVPRRMSPVGTMSVVCKLSRGEHEMILRHDERKYTLSLSPTIYFDSALFLVKYLDRGGHAVIVRIDSVSRTRVCICCCLIPGSKQLLVPFPLNAEPPRRHADASLNPNAHTHSRND